jgi:hypothetical protein
MHLHEIPMARPYRMPGGFLVPASGGRTALLARHLSRKPGHRLTPTKRRWARVHLDAERYRPFGQRTAEPMPRRIRVPLWAVAAAIFAILFTGQFW